MAKSVLFSLLVTVVACTGVSLSVQAQKPLPLSASASSPSSSSADFVCPDEFGYFPHPSDCSQYYVCVFGGALLESCTGGLMYSTELQTCDWPRNVNNNQQCAGNSSAIAPHQSLLVDSQQQPVVVSRGRVRSTTTQSSSYAYAPIKIESYGDLREALNNQQQQQQQQQRSPGGSGQLDEDEYLQSGRAGRSYAQDIPDYKNSYGKQQAEVPLARSRRSLTLLGYFMDKMGMHKKIKPKVIIHATRKVPAEQEDRSHHHHQQQQKVNNSFDSSAAAVAVAVGRSAAAGAAGPHPPVGQRSPHGPHPGSIMYPSSHYYPTFGSILHPLDLRTTHRPNFDNYFALTTTTTTTTQRPHPPAVHVNFRSTPRPPSNRPIVLKTSGILKHPSSHTHHNNNNHLVSNSHQHNQHNQVIRGHHHLQEQQQEGHQQVIRGHHHQVTKAGPHHPLKQQFIRQNKHPPPPTRDFDYNDNDSDNDRDISGSVGGSSKYSTAGDLGSRYRQPQSQSPAGVADYDPYSNQRYASHIPVNNTPSYVFHQNQQTPPSSSATAEDDSSYYVYEDEEDDSDYKYKQPITYRTTTTTTTTTTTPRPPPPQRTRSKSSSSSSSSSGSNSGRRPTLKPKGSIVPKEAVPVRDVYLDAPSRPAPLYATPKSNGPSTKCRKDVCVLPDCSCGGKDIPGGLRPEVTPQIVLLTFDDSVNDLNKNLYKDLFEKGRKNPNGCPISATFYVSHEWTDYSQVQNLAADGHEIASHSVSHSFGESFSAKKWEKEMNGQREILAAYGGVKLSAVRGMRAPFLAIGGNNMFKMLHDANFTYDSSMPVYENRPPSWPYTLDYKIFHDCMIPPCPTKSYPGVWEVPMVMWQDLKGGRCSMGDACSNPPTAEGVYQMLAKNFERHYTTNRAPFGLYYHAAWFTQAHHKEGFEAFLDTLVQMDDVWLVTNYQAIQWIRNPTPTNHINSFAPFNSCHDPNHSERPARCAHPRVCNLWHKSGVRYMKTCQPCPQQYPWTGNTGVPFTI